MAVWQPGAAVTSRGETGSCLDNGISDARWTSTRGSSWAGWIDQQVAGSYDVVVDMNQQPGARDNRTENVQVDESNGIFSVSINGRLLHRDSVSNVNSFQLVGANDAENVTVRPGSSRIRYSVNTAGGHDRVSVVTTDTNDSVNVYRDQVRALGSTVTFRGNESIRDCSRMEVQSIVF